ncbi:HlyD family secretion protein [Planomicrobium koreense]|uniref:HlyD family secretion protein n=1 Tax=Planococcus koreensis TaxID=112331 RepID=A0A7W8CQ69_9BACL|nr:efflux RND transporter periplasmic adaptor subunit [Planococcus koreensis]MBB5179431.1 HlyD family secretion protein [Planococcus koreensis]
MNKFFFIGLSIAVTAFLTANALLLFGEKSIISKNVYVSEYEQAYTDDYEENLPKEAVAAPLSTVQIYVQDSQAIEQWLVEEGDVVQAGSELAALNEAESEDQRAVWESEKSALESEKGEVQSSLQALESARSSNSGSESRSDSDRSSDTDDDGNTVNFNVDLNVGVEVPQDGSYAAGIAQAEQRLAAIDSQLAVVNAQLNQSASTPALISPAEGTIAKINRTEEPLSVEIYSPEKTFVTYLLEDEWHEVAADDRVMVQAEGLGQAVPGTILSVDAIPAEPSKWLEAYKGLDPIEQANPIAFYKVQIGIGSEVEAALPLGSSANAEIIINEAIDVVALPEPWIFDRYDTSGSAYVLSKTGKAALSPVIVGFDVGGKAVLNDGIESGSIVLNERKLREFQKAPRIFVPFPSKQPDYEFAKATNWRKYVEYLLAR